MELAKRLRQLRKENNLTQAKLSSMLNYGYTAIANYESGRNEPSLKDVRKLANIFNVSVDYLIGNSNIAHQKQNNYYEKLNYQLKQNGISIENTDYFFIDLLYHNTKELSIGKNITEQNIDKLFEMAIEHTQQSFSKFLLLLLQNRLYYNIVKNTITEEFYNKN